MYYNDLVGVQKIENLPPHEKKTGKCVKLDRLIKEGVQSWALHHRIRYNFLFMSFQECMTAISDLKQYLEPSKFLIEAISTKDI